MPKSHIAAGPITPEELRNRIRDEQNSITPGVDFGSKPFSSKDIPPAPSITELGVPLSIRKRIEVLVAHQAELGKIARDAEKQRDMVTDQLKALFAEHLSDDVPIFQVGDCRVARFTMNRPSFSKDIMRDSLLAQGVKPAIIIKAMETATTVKPVEALKITAMEE